VAAAARNASSQIVAGDTAAVKYAYSDSWAQQGGGGGNSGGILSGAAAARGGAGGVSSYDEEQDGGGIRKSSSIEASADKMWVEQHDRISGKQFWVNNATGAVSFSRPRGV
jgi:hypothetical protein